MIDGARTCVSCGLIIHDVQIVSEVEFGESASGAARVEGGQISNDKGHANTLPGGLLGYGNGQESREITEANSTSSSFIALFIAKSLTHS